ncbi:MAG: GTP cyclohydrolase II [Alphaproteobacteria bacterium]
MTSRASSRTAPSLLDRLSLAEVERALSDVRRGLPVLVLPRSGGPALAAPAELAREDTIDFMAGLSHTHARLVLSHGRAATLKIRRYTPEGIVLADRLQAEDIRALSDPSLDLNRPLQGPFEALRDPPAMPLRAALDLMKLAELLPAALMAPVSTPKPRDWAHSRRLTSVTAEAIEKYHPRTAETLELMASARLPLRVQENTHILAFRSPGGGADHFALLVGDPDPASAPLTRIHSQCFTGDLLGSLKCDCGAQLRLALERMGEEGSGVLLYLMQEGRGIGLVNKLRAYRLQDQGFDTVQANQRLGFGIDERAYRPAAEILKKLGFTRIRLLTNNPAKISGLEHCGVRVTERLPLITEANPHNAEYLRAKADKTGHKI